jgi:hemin uptake protein HemP
VLHKDAENRDHCPAPGRRPGEVVIPAARLFGDRKEIWIDHNGERYRLRITRRGKLILQK